MHQDPGLVSAKLRLIVFSLALGNFAVGLGAFIVVGLLTPIAGEFAVSTSDAGGLLSIYALVYALSSPVLIAVTGQARRKLVLIISLMTFAFGAILSTIAWNWDIMLISRAISAIGGGVFTPAAASVVYTLSAPDHRGRMLSAVFLGITLSQALGVPLALLVSKSLGWPVSFGIIAGLAVTAMLAIALFLPRTTAAQANSLRMLVRSLGDWRTLSGVSITLFYASGFCMVYAYLSPLLQQSGSNVVIALTVYGIAGSAGGLFVGRLADRWGANRVLTFIVASQILMLPIFSFLPLPTPLVYILVAIWSGIGVAFIVPQQVALVARSPERQSVILAFNSTANYLGASVGAGLGGLVVAYAGLDWLGLVAAVIGIIAIANLLAVRALDSSATAPPTG